MNTKTGKPTTLSYVLIGIGLLTIFGACVLLGYHSTHGYPSTSKALFGVAIGVLLIIGGAQIKAKNNVD